MKTFFECKIDNTTTLLRILRNNEEITQEEIAKKAGTSKTVISAFECQRREPTLNWVKRVAAAMGYEVKFVMTKTIKE